MRHWPDGAESAVAPEKAVLHFPGGLGDFLAAELEGRAAVTPAAAPRARKQGHS